MKTCKDCTCEIIEKIRCVECQKIFKHNIYLRNKENQLKRQKKKRENNLEEYKIYSKNYYNNNKEKCNEACKLYKKKRRKEDSLYKLKENIRSNIGRTFRDKNITKNSKTFEILGCDFETFKNHIESLWDNWMNWNNYGIDNLTKLEPNKTWDIDHHIPVSKGKNEEEIIKLNHYTNLKPLCSYYNRIVKRNN